MLCSGTRNEFVCALAYFDPNKYTLRPNMTVFSDLTLMLIIQNTIYRITNFVLVLLMKVWKNYPQKFDTLAKLWQKYKIHLSVYITWNINFALLLFVTEFVLKHLEEIRSALCNVFQVAKASARMNWNRNSLRSTVGSSSSLKANLRPTTHC